MRELDTIGVNLQDLHYVWVVGTHHMETHLYGRGEVTDDRLTILPTFVTFSFWKLIKSTNICEVQ